MYPAHNTRKREGPPSSPSEASITPVRRSKRRRRDDGHLETTGTLPTVGTIDSRRPRKTPSTKRSSKRSPPPSGILSHAKDFVINNSVLQNVQTMDSGLFMKDFVRYTLPGAEYDSSARDPPPRCHPGTRLSSLLRARQFLDAHEGHKHLLWIVGPAGVGKSAIMQSIAESISGVKVSIFFSVNVRDDPSKLFPTIAFQIATEYTQYCNHIQKRFARDPTMPEKSLETQFNILVVEPFLAGIISTGSHPIPILVDGLDECRDKDEAQCRLLALIAKFISQYPSAPFVWIIASRPEPNITTFFNRQEHVDIYEKEEIAVDSNEACKDVERHLRTEFEWIRGKHAALMFLRQWPQEKDFLLIAAAAKGLFAYSSTAMKFVDDPVRSDPESQLQILLSVIDGTAQHNEGEADPMAQLHRLYDYVLDRIPSEDFPTTRKFLTRLWGPFVGELADSCDWLCVPLTKAYASLHSLHSVLDIPLPEVAEVKKLKSYHKLFNDYVEKKFVGISTEGGDLDIQCSVRILEQIKDELVENISNAIDRIELCWPHQDKNSTMMVQRKLYWRASELFVSSVYAARRLVTDDQTFVHCFKVLDASYVHDHDRFEAWPWHKKSEKDDIVSWPIWRNNHFFIPIKAITSDHYKTRCQLRLTLCSNNSTGNSKYGLVKGHLECHNTGHFSHGMGVTGHCMGFYRPNWDVGAPAPCACMRYFQQTINLVRKETPEHQVMVITGIDGAAVVIGRVVHPRDEDVELQFTWCIKAWDPDPEAEPSDVDGSSGLSVEWWDEDKLSDMCLQFFNTMG